MRRFYLLENGQLAHSLEALHCREVTDWKGSHVISAGSESDGYHRPSLVTYSGWYVQ